MNVTDNVTHGGGSLLGHPAVFGFRVMFYACAPSEASFAEPHQVPNYVGQATPFFLTLLVLESIILYIRGGKSKLPRFNDTMSSVGAGLVSQLPLLLMRNIEMSTYTWIYNNYRLYELPWDSAVTWWLCMLGVDLGYYWVHRCAHEVNFMWAGHQTHHSSQEYNLSTALRQGVFQRYSSWIFYLPLALFIPPAIFIVHIQFNLLFQFWIHTEAIGRLGPLEYILNTPSHHRVHHGVNRYCIDKNYAGVLIIWDRIFGTFTPEDKSDEVVYGLTHQLNTWDPIYAQVHQWKSIIRRISETDGLVNKLSVALKGPGWEPGKPRLGRIEDIPDAHAPAQKYDSNVSGLLGAYSVIQFGLALGLHEVLVHNSQSINWWTMLLLILFIIWTLTNIGYCYDNKRQLAGASELARCLAVLSLDYYMFNSSLMYPYIIPAIRFSALAGTLISLYQLDWPTINRKKVD